MTPATAIVVDDAQTAAALLNSATARGFPSGQGQSHSHSPGNHRRGDVAVIRRATLVTPALPETAEYGR